MRHLLAIPLAGALLTAACAGQQANASTVDLNLDELPLQVLAAELGECSAIHGSVHDPYWAPTITDAKTVGYGISDGQSALLDGQVKTAQTSCEGLVEKGQALDSLVVASSMMPETKSLFEAVGSCLSDKGFGSIANPAQRNGAVLSQLYSSDEKMPIDTAVKESLEVKKFEVSMAVADVECRSKTLQGHFEALEKDQQTAIENAPSEVVELLGL